MTTTKIHKARDLSEDERRTIEHLLGPALEEVETVRVSALAEGIPERPLRKQGPLPVWHGEVIGDLRRQDLYDDAG